MEKILVYTQSLNYLLISTALDDREIIPVNSKYELAVKITEEDDIFCVILQLDNLQEDADFLISVKKCFPILPVIILCTEATADNIKEPDFSLIKFNGDKEEVKNRLKTSISNIKVRNKRENRRFKWPLKGYLSFDKKTWAKYSIKSISSNGAFLECNTTIPNPGKKAILRIIFKNFKMYTICEILDPRLASSNLPDGFGVEFTKFSEPSRKIINNIIDDALVKVLIDPDSEPEIPSIGNDELLIDRFELL